MGGPGDFTDRDQESLAAALRPVLDRLTSSGISRRKQEGTILAIAEHHATGQAFDTAAFWKRPDTCARSTYKKYRKDQVFVDVLEEAKTVVAEWRIERAAAVVEDALLQLQMATPDFVEQVVKIANTGKNEFARLQAALGGLDRASKMTANKSALVNMVLEHVDVKQLSDDQLNALGDAQTESDIIEALITKQ